MPETKAQISSHSGFHRFIVPLIAATIGGGLAGIAILKLGNHFTYPPEIEAVIYDVNANVDFEEVNQLDRQLLMRNTTLSATVAGILVAGLLGLGLGLIRTRSGALKGFGLGLVFGAFGGAIGGFAGATTWQYLVDNAFFMETSTETSTHAAIGNCIIWSVIGIACGLTAGRGSRINAMIAGMMGGAFAAWVFFLLAAFTMPSAKLDVPIPGNVEDTSWIMARILWAIVPAAIIGLFVARATAFKSEHAPLEETSAATS